MLSNKDLRSLSGLTAELQHGFQRQQAGRPRYLMQVSVLKDMKFPTPDAKYWQSLLERDVQFRNLVMLAYDFKEKCADIEIKEAEIEDLGKDNNRLSAARIKKLQTQIERERATLIFMKREAEERIREVTDWTEIIREVEPRLKYSRDNPEEHMPESFLLRFASQKQVLDEIGAADMNGAMNIIALGQTASRYWKEQETKREQGGDYGSNMQDV